jgi:nucleoside-diphosphate-sugar epimerase
MEILVTGGAGFIGSHLCERLLEKEHHVFCMDNLLTGDKENIRHLESDPNFKFILSDVIQPFNLDVEVIVHLASPASPVDYTRFQVETMLVNSLGTYNALELASKTGARMILASTSEVYGDPQVSPQPEGYFGHVNPVGPRSCYDESKRFAEALTYTYVHRHNVYATIVRIFNTFGPRMRKNDGRVIPNFINQALEGKPLTIYGDGTQTRSFCYIDDLIDALDMMIDAKDLAGEVINLGSEAEMTVLELAQLIKRMTGSSSELAFLPLPQDDPLQRRPDLSKAKDLLGWEPRISLEEGLSRVIEWFKQRKG